ncbi:MAG: hypothetical protein Q8K38_01000 [Burkholderiaceae bacterium]|nr:hypothetical protein [Burkholderiaceae bacterium]MDZ4144630.1 hypothetical protein [Burkholderiales bacterium]
MDWLRRVPGSRREPPGLEWKLWRKLPVILLLGTVLPVLVAVAVHLWVDTDAAPALARQVLLTDYIVAAVVVLHWTTVLTVAIGCVVVMIMKGPAYEADPYPVPGPER